MTNLLKDLNIIKNDYCLENQNVTTINENDEEFKNSITSINSTQSSLINKKSVVQFCRKIKSWECLVLC